MAVVAAIVTLIICAVLFGYKGKRPRLLPILQSIYRTGLDAVDIIVICAGAGVVIGVLSISGLGFSLTLTLVQIGRDNIVVLLCVVAIVCIILGMGLPTVGVYVLLAVLVAPAMVKLGVEPIAAHLYVMYFGLLSFLTPPVAVAAYAAAAIAKADPIATAMQSMRFGWTAYIVPFLFVFAPALIMQGAAIEIAAAVTTALVGVYLTSVGMVGYFLRPLRMVHRVAFVVAGIAALVPAGAFPNAVYTDVAGMLMGALLLGLELRNKGKANRADTGTRASGA
jgi:TRAP-type uncharacterized transport system fused permease subunit